MRKALTGLILALGLGVSSMALAQNHDGHAAGPPQTAAGWARGAQLFTGLGDFERKVTTRSPLAQRYFDQGMRFLWGFNHDEATRSFAKAAQLDPRCASCWWGVALTLGPNYNMPMMTEARARVGWHALRRAKANARHAAPVERELIAAVAKRFSGPAAVDPTNSAPLLKAYVEAMRAVAKRYPNDADVQTMFAEGLMNTNPWKLWSPNGSPGPGTPEIVAVLGKVLKASPRHPGANHYWIHAVEASRNPEHALASAEVLTGMMPAAGHIEHMPAHIMQRVGRYAEAEEANRKAAAADVAYLKRTAAPDYYPMYLIHNYQFLANSAAMAGRSREALEALRTALKAMPDEMLLAMPGVDWGAGFLYDGLVSFGRWDEMVAEPAPNPRLIGLMVGYLQSRAIALAMLGREAEVQTALKDAEAAIARSPADAIQGMNAAKDVYAVGQLKARARVASRAGKRDEAIALLREAAEIDLRLSYNEPRDVFMPVTHVLAGELLAAGKASDAEAVYRADLKRFPNDGWALFGLGRALAAQGKASEAAAVQTEFDAAWKRADIKLTASAF